MTADDSLTVVTSFAQQSLWLQHQVDPDRAAYNITAAVRLRGPLDSAALERALNAVVARHEVLRTDFALDGEDPVQVVRPERELRVPVLDAGPDDFLRYAGKVLFAPFDLRGGPLLRLELLRLGPEHHIALLALHHIVTDGASSAILLQELSHAYAAELAGVEPLWEELPIQYADFAVWQRDALSGAALDELTGHWTRTLAGAEPLALPADRERDADASGHAAVHHFTLPAALTARLEDLARAERATLFMVLLAGLDALLARYCGQEDITVVSPMAGRGRPELEGLIGYFVNPLLLRTQVSGTAGFAALVGRTRDTCLDAFDREELPFEQAVEVLRGHGAPGAESLRSQVMLVLQNTRPNHWHSAGIDFELIPADTSTAKSDLVLEVRPGADGGCTAALEYRTGLYDAATADRVARHFAAILEAACERPDEPLSQLLATTVPDGEIPAVRSGAAHGEAPAATEYVAPRTPLEEEVAGIWSALLGTERVGVHDNFFDLGGQSLLAVRLAARLRDEFGVEMTVRDLYADFTLEAVTWAVLQRMTADGEQAPA
uniref:Nonribosomal peptide synthetase n=1 Tax=Streptomyces atroolivaceus TaxID=66869 RepID=Q8GGR2_STRAZ|nr:nonribosomal peptide synthetase [Streptomyces atroolivaceus]